MKKEWQSRENEKNKTTWKETLHLKSKWGRHHSNPRLLHSKSGVIVRGCDHLKDALCVILQQRTPFHFPRQQQVLAIKSVNKLHLQEDEKKNI